MIEVSRPSSRTDRRAADAHRLLSIAPMMDRSDRHFRFLTRLLAPHALLYTEMLTARALLRGDAARLLRFDESEHPVALQLGGNDPDELAAAAVIGEEAGYDEINLNVGCPSDRVQAGCFGAALMLDRDRVSDCVASMRAAVGVPVTVKTRLGVDDHDSYEFLSAFVASVAAAGCQTFVVHARKAWLTGLSPKQNREIPPLDYARVHRIKRDFPALTVVINGGLTDLTVSLAQLEHVDGVMLGRAAYESPWLIASLDAALFDSPPNRAMLSAGAVQVEHVLERFLPYAEHEIAQGTPLRAMTRHLLGLRGGQPGGRLWRRTLSEMPDGRSGLARLRGLLEQLAVVDSLAAVRRPAYGIC
jgi:tRNA-dihydrouridine synthase A